MEESVLVDITPDKSLIHKLGLVGYRTEQAIAELIDNSIDARRGRSVDICVCLDFVNRQITIKDNGSGMDKKGLTDAMTIARGSKKEGSLGIFGIGMKSACSFLGKRFAVTTRTDSGQEYFAEYDEKRWMAGSEGWGNFEIQKRDSKSKWHGTEIKISGINIPMYPGQVTKFKEGFGIRYAPYIESKQATIRINSVLCPSITPDIIKESKTNISIQVATGEIITGDIALQSRRSIKGSYGIHLYKNNRLIKVFEKFGFVAHPENAKVIGRLNLDHVPVNFNKTEFIKEDPRYKRAENAFASSKEIKHMLRMSKSRGKDPESLESIFGYFAGGGPHQLERSMNANAVKQLKKTDPFTVKIRGTDTDISIKSEKGKPFYSMLKNNAKNQITINMDAAEFDFVKNPLFLAGLIGAEVELASEWPEYAGMFEKRNHRLQAFLQNWAKTSQGTQRHGGSKQLSNNPNYNLQSELVDMHEFLVESYGFRFQFTALSTLLPYLHNVRSKPVYSLYTEPDKSEYLAGMISDFAEGFTVVCKPDSKLLDTLSDMKAVERIIVIREYLGLRRSTIAPLEKALVDLVVEAHTYHMRIDDAEIRQMFQGMVRRGLNIEEFKKWGRRAKKSVQLSKLLGVKE